MSFNFDFKSTMRNSINFKGFMLSLIVLPLKFIFVITESVSDCCDSYELSEATWNFLLFNSWSFGWCCRFWKIIKMIKTGVTFHYNFYRFFQRLRIHRKAFAISCWWHSGRFRFLDFRHSIRFCRSVDLIRNLRFLGILPQTQQFCSEVLELISMFALVSVNFPLQSINCGHFIGGEKFWENIFPEK